MCLVLYFIIYFAFSCLFHFCSSPTDTSNVQPSSEITHHDADTTTGRITYSEEEACVYIFLILCLSYICFLTDLLLC